MVSLPVKNMQGAEVGTYEFDENELASSVNRQLLHDVVVMYEANKRVGTSRTKSRAEVRGTTQKMYRQKGTGRARAGSRRSPVRVGGGHAFAKRPKDWSYRLPKKAVRQATRMAVLSKIQDGQVVVLDDLAVPEPKTKTVVSMLSALDAGGSSFIAIGGHDSNAWKSCRNIQGVSMAPVGELNARDVLRRRTLVVTQAALDKLRGVE